MLRQRLPGEILAESQIKFRIFFWTNLCAGARGTLCTPASSFVLFKSNKHPPSVHEAYGNISKNLINSSANCKVFHLNVVDWTVGCSLYGLFVDNLLATCLRRVHFQPCGSYSTSDDEVCNSDFLDFIKEYFHSCNAALNHADDEHHRRYHCNTRNYVSFSFQEYM